MRFPYGALASLLLFSIAAPAGQTAGKPAEQIEDFLVVPTTRGKTVDFTLKDHTIVTGKVVGGDDEKVVIQDAKGARTELPLAKVLVLQFRRAKRSGKLDFAGSLAGGIGLGVAGAAAGRQIGQNIHSDGSAGRAAPLAGGVGLGFLGGYLGKVIVRHLATEQVTLTVISAEEPAPKPPQPQPPPARK